MKQILYSAFVAIFSVIPSISFAIDSITGAVSDDMYYQSGVLITDVTLPNDLDAQTGSSVVLLDGTGTVTVGSRASSGFPKMMILGGTTITSTRSWAADEATKSWWEGQLDSPSVGRKPDVEEISFVNAGSHKNNTYYAVETYQLGLPNEIFSFSNPVHVALPVGELDGTKIWIATMDTGSGWQIADNNYCIVSNGVCVKEFANFGAITLVKENLQSCPNSTIENGKLSGVPNCILECNRGYLPNDTWSACVAVDPNDAMMADVVMDGAGIDGGGITPGGMNEVRTWRHGYFRYRDTRAQSSRYLDEDLVEGAAQDRVRRLNDGYLSRNPRSSKEQLCEGGPCGSGVDDGGADDSFMNYLLEMRRTFATNDNNFTQEGGVDNQALSVVESEVVSGSGQRLPSTGPGAFVGLAALGLGAMAFGARRRRQ